MSAERTMSVRPRLARRARWGRLCIRHSLFTTPRSHSGFTLIELIVAVGLMAIFMTMLATLFGQAGAAFSIARASVEIHQNARGAFDVMVRDFAAARLCSYEDRIGYFAVGWAEEPEWAAAGATDPAVPFIAFTTLAEQPGAKPLVPGVSSQVALVRYALRFNGGAVRLPDPDNPEKTVEHPTFDLIKQVRFPQLAYSTLDIESFPMPGEPDDVKRALIPDETCTTDVIAVGVIEMRTRILYAGHYIEVLDHGRATRDSGFVNEILRLADGSDKAWPASPGPMLPANTDVRVVGGYGAPAVAEINRPASTATDLVATAGFAAIPRAQKTAFRIEQRYPASDPPYSRTDSDGTGTADGLPVWLEPPARDEEVVAGRTYSSCKMYPMLVIERVAHTGSNEMEIRMPYVVEVTLRIADQRTGTGKEFTFTERFHIRSSTD